MWNNNIGNASGPYGTTKYLRSPSLTQLALGEVGDAKRGAVPSLHGTHLADPSASHT